MNSRVRSYVGLGALGAGSLFSFTRVFTGSDWVIPVFGALGTAMAITVLFDRIKAPAPLRTILFSVAGVWFIALFIVPESTNFGLPNLDKLIETGRLAFEDVFSATTLLKPEPGVLLLVVAAVWAAVMVSEQVAGAGRPILTALPWIGLFSLNSATGVPAGRTATVLAFFVGLLTQVFFVRGPRDETNPGEPERTRRGARIRNASDAGVLGGVAAAFALLVPQIMPGFKAPAWFESQLKSPSSQTVISPLVQIRPQLQEVVHRKLFEVRATVPAGTSAYWRLVALDDFDGSIWGTSAEYRRVRGKIPYLASEMFHGRGLELNQQFKIANLGGPWLPAAYQALSVSGSDTSADLSSSSIVAQGTVGSGVSYSVTSNIPQPSSADLASAPPATRFDHYLKLTGVSDAVRQIAQTWTKDKATPYDKVLAISQQLRRFRYDESVDPGHSGDDLLEFLTKTRAGYCEQFSASMAVLARSLGIPSRVAVGFISGDYDPVRGSFSVSTTHAHAWPEIYFSGIGWVPFEPTPRGGLAPPSYAGGFESAPEPVAGEEIGEAQEQPQPSPQPPQPPPSPESQVQEPRARAASRAWLIAAIITAGLFVLVAGAIAKRIRSRSRYRRAISPSDMVRAAYFDFEDRLIDLSRPRLISQTPAEFVGETRVDLRLDDAATGILLGAFEKMAFASEGPSGEEARAALQAAAHLSAQLWGRAGWVGRLGLLVSPRSLLARSPKIHPRR